MDNQRSSLTHSLISYFIVTFSFSWLFWLLPVLASQSFLTLPMPNMVWVIIGAHGPLVAAIILTAKTGGWAAVKELLRSGFNFRMSLKWWVLIIALPIVLTGIAVWANILINNYQPDTTLLSQPLMIVPTFLLMFFLGGSFQEEFGWRGYALPRLLKLANPLNASLLLGAVWGLWHLPLFYVDGASQAFMPFGIFLLLAIGFSVMFTWFFFKTKFNLFSALLFHTAINTSLSLFPPIEQKVGGDQMALTYLMILFVLVSALAITKEWNFWKTKVVSEQRLMSNRDILTKR